MPGCAIDQWFRDGFGRRLTGVVVSSERLVWRCVSSWQSRLQAVQLALLDEDFNLDDVQRAFVQEYLVNGENGTAAAQKAKPRLKRESAEKQARRWLKDREVARYLDKRCAEAALRAELLEDEVIENARVSHAAAMGLIKLRKSVLRKTEGEDGLPRTVVDHVEVYEANLTAANSANEMLRKIGGFGVERSEVTQSPAESLEDLDDDALKARVKELAGKAGFRVEDADR